MSLDRLQEEGLVRPRAVSTGGGDIHCYELSGLGNQALDLIERIEQVATQPLNHEVPAGSGNSNTWHVRPAESGGWSVIRVGADRASSRHGTKDEAVDRGREITRRDRGRLVLHYEGGRIQRHLSYDEA